MTLLNFEAPWYVDHLSSRHGASSGCGWRRRPPDMEGTREYIELSSRGQLTGGWTAARWLGREDKKSSHLKDCCGAEDYIGPTFWMKAPVAGCCGT